MAANLKSKILPSAMVRGQYSSISSAFDQPQFSLNTTFKGTVSPVKNYLKVKAFKSPWYGHMAPDIKSFFKCHFNLCWAYKDLMLRLQNHSKLF